MKCKFCELPFKGKRGDKTCASCQFALALYSYCQKELEK